MPTQSVLLRAAAAAWKLQPNRETERESGSLWNCRPSPDLFCFNQTASRQMRVRDSYLLHKGFQGRGQIKKKLTTRSLTASRSNLSRGATSPKAASFPNPVLPAGRPTNSMNREDS